LCNVQELRRRHEDKSEDQSRDLWHRGQQWQGGHRDETEGTRKTQEMTMRTQGRRRRQQRQGRAQKRRGDISKGEERVEGDSYSLLLL
jgi:hypothetical protein